MPPKNCELGPGTLFICSQNGEKEIIIPTIRELEISYTEEDCESVNYPFLLNSDYTCEFSGRIVMCYNKFLYHFVGRSNNWLKMHGEVMIRRRRK